jgi:hypothetical protein
MGTPYDSTTERDLHLGPLKEASFHKSKVSYIIEHKYSPDFEYKNLLIEVKGYFQDSKEIQKYPWIKQALVGSGKELIFVFPKPHQAIHFKTKRKACGTKMTHAEWAEKNGFRWFDCESIREVIDD